MMVRHIPLDLFMSSDMMRLRRSGDIFGAIIGGRAYVSGSAVAIGLFGEWMLALTLDKG